MAVALSETLVPEATQTVWVPAVDAAPPFTAMLHQGVAVGASFTVSVMHPASPPPSEIVPLLLPAVPLLLPVVPLLLPVVPLLLPAVPLLLPVVPLLLPVPPAAAPFRAGVVVCGGGRVRTSGELCTRHGDCGDGSEDDEALHERPPIFLSVGVGMALR